VQLVAWSTLLPGQRPTVGHRVGRAAERPLLAFWRPGWLVRAQSTRAGSGALARGEPTVQVQIEVLPGPRLARRAGKAVRRVLLGALPSRRGAQGAPSGTARALRGSAGTLPMARSKRSKALDLPCFLPAARATGSTKCAGRTSARPTPSRRARQRGPRTRGHSFRGELPPPRAAPWRNADLFQTKAALAGANTGRSSAHTGPSYLASPALYVPAPGRQPLRRPLAGAMRRLERAKRPARGVATRITPAKGANALEKGYFSAVYPRKTAFHHVKTGCLGARIV